jgi:trigger factor
MDVQLETPGGLSRQLRVRIPPDRIASALDDRLKKIAARARIPGFRPGKAPLKVVEAQYGDAARLEVIQDLVRGSYPEAVDKAGVHPASAPSFEVVAEKPGEPLEYVARFEVYPEIKLRALSEIKVERPSVEVAEADVDRMVDSLRRGRRTLEPVTRASREGDVVKLDFEGFIDEVAFEGGKGADAQVELGRGQFLPDLERGIVGHAAGESFDVGVLFPADYRAEALRGKKANFKVRLKEVQEPRLPEIDAAFLKAHGVEEAAGVEGLRAKVRDALTRERDKAVKSRLKQQVLEGLLAANPIEVPQAMVAQETGRLREEMAARFSAGKMSDQQKLQLLPDAVLEPQARKRVSLGLLIGEVIKDRKLSFDAARLEQLLAELVADYDQPEQVKQYYRSRPELLQGLRAMVLEEQVVEALLSGITPKDAAMSLDELLKPAASAP